MHAPRCKLSLRCQAAVQPFCDRTPLGSCNIIAPLQLLDCAAWDFTSAAAQPDRRLIRLAGCGAMTNRRLEETARPAACLAGAPAQAPDMGPPLGSFVLVGAMLSTGARTRFSRPGGKPKPGLEKTTTSIRSLTERRSVQS